MTPPRRRDRQLVRVLRLRRELQELGALTLEQFARRFSVNPRTIRRDLYALADAGEPIEHPVLLNRRPEEP